jgi:hypothetical protein
MNESCGWGPWRLCPKTNALVLTDKGGYEAYYVDLNDCLNSAEMLDWIYQVAGKSYASDEVIAGLIRALNDVMMPQASLCSFGQSLEITHQDVALLVGSYAKRHPGIVFHDPNLVP